MKNNDMKKASIILAFCCICIFCCALLFWVNSYFFVDLPNDAELLEHLQNNEQDLEEIVSMVKAESEKPIAEDGFFRIGHDFVDPEDYESQGLSIERVGKYRELMRSAKVGTVTVTKNGIDFSVDSTGLSVSGATAGIVYSETKPHNYFKDSKDDPGRDIKNLDDFEPKTPHSYTIYRHAYDNWYLFYEYED